MVTGMGIRHTKANTLRGEETFRMKDIRSCYWEAATNQLQEEIARPSTIQRGRLCMGSCRYDRDPKNHYANPVMGKKSDGGWRMCVDFTDINKACPKDCYPLPEIDWKVESLSGFRLKCFLDVYKGYHQIQMVEGGEDNIAFFTGKGVFCYRKMPFSLKNARATYQRLVDKVFNDQIERNLEAYVDDMVIKSASE
ncbi:reverse transcriptase domain-containing protein [Tanacetum coccineum]